MTDPVRFCRALACHAMANHCRPHKERLYYGLHPGGCRVGDTGVTRRRTVLVVKGFCGCPTAKNPRLRTKQPQFEDEALRLQNERAQIGGVGLFLSLVPWLGVAAMFLLHPG